MPNPTQTDHIAGDDVLVIHIPPRCSLRKIFLATAVVAMLVVGYLSRRQVPLENVAVMHAVCLKSDWDALDKSPPISQQGEFSAYRFKQLHPDDLVAGFSIIPHFWARNSQADGISSDNNWTMYGRYRTKDRPVDGADRSHENFGEYISDGVWLEEKFSRSSMFNRWHMDIKVGYQSMEYPGRVLLESSSHQLSYNGPLRDELIVFARPKGDDLVQLFIVEVYEK